MSSTPKRSGSDDRIIIRPLSAVVYFYPTLIAALACGAAVQIGGATPSDPGVTGIVFTVVFFFNLSVVGFDYTRLSSIVILLLAVILGLLSAMFPAVGGLILVSLASPLFMNPTFYWTWSAGFALVLVAVFIKTRFDYWEIKNNELLHHHGLLGDVERWPAPNMRITKEIKDVMEYLLARSGRLVLVPARESRAIVLDNVPRIDRVEARMQAVLSTLRVDHSDDP